jgi:signal transduction histidine kinase
VHKLRGIPIRWRLAGGSALLTLLILLVFAIVVGTLTTRRLQVDFNVRVAKGANDLATRVGDTVTYNRKTGRYDSTAAQLDSFVAADKAVVRLTRLDGSKISGTRSAPDWGYVAVGQPTDSAGYRVESRYVPLTQDDSVIAEYGRPLSEVSATKSRIRVFLAIGVLGGALLALVAGLIVGRNAMRPIAQMTATASEVARTRDPDLHVPQPEADDEVGELARTFNEMLAALAASRAETEASLLLQRQFVADASHELRTPLTSVLANLELLVDGLDGDHEEAASSALRSTQRMRRLVTDLLLLARADVRSGGAGLEDAVHAPTSLAQIVVDVAAEIEPVSGDHIIELDVRPAIVDGARDQLHRMTLNLVDNALRHTPPGTRVTVSVAPVAGPDGDFVRLVVEDDGPGIDHQLQERIFQRFVRGEGDRGGSVGLGLSIVRAVVDAHKGSVRVEDAPHGGARFVVDLPSGPPAEVDRSSKSTEPAEERRPERLPPG